MHKYSLHMYKNTCTFLFFVQIFSKQTQIAEVWWFQDKRKMHQRSGGDKNSNLLGSRQDHKHKQIPSACHQFLKIENKKCTQRLDCKQKKKTSLNSGLHLSHKRNCKSKRLKTFRVGWDGKEKVWILELMPYRMQNDDLKNKHLSEQLDTLNACAWLARQAQLWKRRQYREVCQSPQHLRVLCRRLPPGKQSFMLRLSIK